MSQTLEPIPFADDRLTIRPHSASAREHVGAPVSLREFAAGQPTRVLRDADSGEFRFESTDGRFAEGPIE